MTIRIDAHAARWLVGVGGRSYEASVAAVGLLAGLIVVVGAAYLLGLAPLAVLVAAASAVAAAGTSYGLQVYRLRLIDKDVDGGRARASAHINATMKKWCDEIEAQAIERYRASGE